MKKILKPLTLSAIALFAISCSSDDNSTPSKVDDTSIIVIDKLTKDSYDQSTSNGVLQKPKLEYTLVNTFVYDEYGKLINTSSTGKHEMTQPDGGSLFNDKIVYKYDNENRLIEITLTDLIDNTTSAPQKFEYKHPTNKNWVTKMIDTDKDNYEEVIYTYNNQGLVIKADRTYLTNSHNLNYTYDTNKNVSKSTTIITLGGKEYNYLADYTYDDHNTPYKNMNIDNTYRNSKLTDYLPYTLKATNNIKSEKTNDGAIYDNETIYEYNKEGYPIKATTYYTINKEYISSVITYTYKTIKVKK